MVGRRSAALLLFLVATAAGKVSVIEDVPPDESTADEEQFQSPFVRRLDEVPSPYTNDEVQTIETRAEEGNVTAQFALAVMYDTGVGKQQVPNNAFYWYEKAALQGHADSQYRLGAMYQLGRGIWVSQEKAKKWYIKAAEQGVIGAQVNLGIMFRATNVFPSGAIGDNGGATYNKTIEWYEEARARGFADEDAYVG